MVQPKIEGTGHGIPRMTYGSDGTDHYEVAVDSDGHVKADIQTYPGRNAYLNIPFAYNDHYAESQEATSPDGAQFVNTTAVPAGEVWVVTSVCVSHDDATARRLGLEFYDGASHHLVAGVASAAANDPLNRQGMFVLKAGDRMRGRAYGLATGKKVYIAVVGHKMKVA